MELHTCRMDAQTFCDGETTCRMEKCCEQVDITGSDRDVYKCEVNNWKGTLEGVGM